ncbi:MULTISPECIES: hypothetical protein [Mycolicibacterium]|nr:MULTISPECIES: hypothetical protein [Mycolicibacterium]MCV7024381.1 hypothetical protein [Mycolicibacterium novocastrense]MDG5486557.1 hypothetical protein [Mycolicibacterium gadium]
MTTPGVDHLLVPGTWLADVPRELTLEVVDRINLLIGGMNTVRNRMLLGVDSDGNEPSPGRPRSDATAETTRRALEDLILLRDITSTTIHAVAAAAIEGGVERNDVETWASYEADDQALIEGIDMLLAGSAERPE